MTSKNALSQSISIDLVKLLQSIGGRLPMAMITTDEDGIVTAWNSYAEELYGWSAESALGRSITDITVGPVNETLAEEIMVSLSKGDPWFGQFECRRIDGTTIGVGVLAIPISDCKGQFRGVLGFSQIPGLRPSDQLQELDALREFAEQLDIVQSEEQERIGAQLHDELSQPIAMAATELIALARTPDLPDSVATRIDDISSNLQDSLTVLQNLCVSMRPDWLDYRNPSDAIDELIRSWSRATGIQAQILVTPRIDNVDRETVITAMRIIRESLANVERHSSAHQVSVRVTISNDWVITRIVDNGIGFDGTRGFGIRLMEERARRVGGKFSIVGIRTPHPGTAVEFVAPNPPPRSSNEH